MPNAVWMLELAKTRWRLFAGGGDAASEATIHEFSDGNLVDQTDAVCDASATAGYAGEPIIVALDSNMCLAATLNVARPQDLRDRRTMLYRMEELIPWNVEECVADYARAGNRALLVAVLAEPLAEFFSRLIALGLVVQSIVPTALLAIAAHCEQGEWSPQHAVLFNDAEWIDLVWIEEGKPTSWKTLPAHGDTLAQELTNLALQTGTAAPLITYGLQELTAIVQNLGSAGIVQITAELLESRSMLALACAQRIVRGQIEPPVELRRDQFGRARANPALRRYVRVLELSMALLMLCATGSSLYRGHRAAKQVELVAAQQLDVFRSVFPNAVVPVGIRSRLESELAQLKGLQGEDGAAAGCPSATAMLHRLLSAMPVDRRFRLLEIRIEEGRLYLDGEVIAHGDAEVITQRLRAEGFNVAAPRTQRLDDKRVSLRITGTFETSGKPSPIKTT